jgi:hypothetical protein
MSFTFADIKKWALARISPAQKTAGATWAVAHTPGGDLIGKDGETLGGGGSFPSITDDGTSTVISNAGVITATADDGAGNSASFAAAVNDGTFAQIRATNGAATTSLTVQPDALQATATGGAASSDITITTALSRIRSDDGSGNSGEFSATGGNAVTTATDGTNASTVTVAPTAVTINTLAAIFPQVLAQTSDPANAGQLWNNSGVVMISAG